MVWVVSMQASPVETYMMEMTSPDFATGTLDMVSIGDEARQPLQVVLQARYWP